jgi:hypothetical protein
LALVAVLALIVLGVANTSGVGEAQSDPRERLEITVHLVIDGNGEGEIRHEQSSIVETFSTGQCPSSSPCQIRVFPDSDADADAHRQRL